MQIVNALTTRIYTFGMFFMAGLLVLVALQLPLSQVRTLPKVELPIEFPKIGATENSIPLIVAFFGGLPENIANSIVKQKEDFVSTRPAYPAALKVIQKHEDTIREKAQQYGVPADVAIGVGLLENGGSETAKSPAGALGVFQLMPGTARNLGLTVNKKVDQRKDPATNIDAGMRYLSSNYQIFGDWGLATWAYHAGEGNVAKAVQLYFKEKNNIKLAGLKDADQMKRYIANNDTTVNDVLSSTAVQKFTKKLHDDSAAYPYKVLATAKLFREAI